MTTSADPLLTVEPVGVIHGRFQPLHLGHIEYLLAASRHCRMLVVGITSPDPWLFGVESTDLERGRKDANPFTFYERYLMIESALTDAGVLRERMRIVPFPHSYPERLRYYAPTDALYLLSIYDSWGEVKLQRLAELGLRTHVLWRRSWRLTSGSEVRELIRAGDDRWRDLVPAAAASIIDACRVDGGRLEPAVQDSVIKERAC